MGRVSYRSVRLCVLDKLDAAATALLYKSYRSCWRQLPVQKKEATGSMYWWNIEAGLAVKAAVAQCFSTFLCPGMRAGCVYFGCAMSLTLVYAGG